MSDMHAHSVAFVRTETIPESPPPTSEAGAYKWARENLFNGWLNSLLTVAGIYVIYLIIIAWV